MRSLNEAIIRALELAQAGADRSLVEAAVTDEERDAEVRRRIAQREEGERALELKKRAELLRDLGEFPVHALRCAQSPVETGALQSARQFLQTRKRILVLAGGVGAGKTTAATWIALSAGGSDPFFVRANDLESRGRYDRGIRDRIKACSALVIDDLGAEYMDAKGAFRSLMDEVVDTAYSRDRLLLLTTNLLPRRTGHGDEPQFFERYGDRVASRLSQVGMWASCGNRDLRRDQLALVPDGDS